MKKLLFVLMLSSASFGAKSQVVDTTIKSITAVKIVPVTVQAAWPSLDTCTHLGLRGQGDDFSGRAQFECILLAHGKNIIVSTYVLESEDYQTWVGDSRSITTLFQLVAYRKGLTFLADNH